MLFYQLNFIITTSFWLYHKDMNIKKVFGHNLYTYRKKAKISQEELSEELDISQKHVSDLEMGKSFVSAELLERISQVLRVSPSSLFYSPEENSLDESRLSQIDRIIEEEAAAAVRAAKLRIRGVEC